MAYVRGFEARVWGGSSNLSVSIRSTSTQLPTQLLDVTTLNDGSYKAYIMGRQEDATFSADGPLDVATSTNEPWDVMTGWIDAPMPITYMPRGDTALAECWLYDAIQSSLGVTGAAEGTVDFSISASTTGVVGTGNVLEPMAAKTTTGNGTERDGVAASANGAIFHLHVTEWSGLTSNTVTVEDSADGSTGWGTIATFDAATGVTSQRLTITGTVKQHLRVVDTIVGSGSCTRGVAYARL